MKKISQLFRSAIRSFSRRPEGKTGGPATTSPHDEKVRKFIRRHKKRLAELGLGAGPSYFFRDEERSFSAGGIQIDLRAHAELDYDVGTLGHPDLLQPEAAGGLLIAVRDQLAADLEKELRYAEEAFKKLTDVASDPRTRRWIAEDVIREKYLNFPPEMPAHAAERAAKNNLRSLREHLGKVQFDVVRERVRALEGVKINKRELSARFEEDLKFLTPGLKVDLHVQVNTNDREIQRLAEKEEAQTGDAVRELLSKARRTLADKVQTQLSDLERRIRALPHIELLTEEDIASTVAPYYGGLSRDLKIRRAKNALVAVEERAREAKYHEDVSKLVEKRDLYADVAGYYPVARSLKRELILYVGPTNSGKTWRSLNDLASASSGAYLAPLRLLALEGQEELEKRGKTTSYITGEERDLRADAQFTSSTIEMLNTDKIVDAVVIDEVQMLADERRGWAWLAAVVGAPATRIIMTGSPDCIGIVQDLASYLGETLTIVECQRYNELRVADKPMRLRDIRKGMAIVCFSRRDVQRIKNTIQENSDLKVAVIYGNLSPRARREEARRFNSREADILVATDAIAMGLNLPISEVLFYTTQKFNGEEMVEISSSDIRQIGGRAGRYGFANYGIVNALDNDSLDLIKAAFAEQPEALTPPYYVAPGPNHIRIISDVLGTDSLERILTFFMRAVDFLDDRFTRANIDDLSILSSFVDQRLPFLPVTERLTIASTPVGIRNETVMRWFTDRMLNAFPDPENPDAHDDLDDLFLAARRFDREKARNQLDLRDAEDYLKTLTVYAWLSFRYPNVFTRIEECEARRDEVNGFVERTLRSEMTHEHPPRERRRGGRKDRGPGRDSGNGRSRDGGKGRGGGRRGSRRSRS